jgi:hypothetical protein
MGWSWLASRSCSCQPNESSALPGHPRRSKSWPVISRSTGKKISAWDLKQHPDFKDKSDEQIAQDNAARAKRINLADPKNKDLANYKEQILALEQQHEQKVKALPKEQLKTIGSALVVWIAPALALLALGQAIGWVRGGFRKAT